MNLIYLDNAATTPVDKEVADTAMNFMAKEYGNASTLYSLGRDARTEIENARKKIAEFLNVSGSEIVFTSGGTESNNLAIKEIAFLNKDKGNHIVTSSIEHPSVLEVCKFLEKQGFKVTYIPVSNEGIVNPRDIESAITKETILVSIMHVNNEIGTIQPVEKISGICRAKNIIFHTDAVQSFGKLKIDASKFDMLSASGHKINAPKGVGFLYIRKGTRISPLFHGGGQESRIRSGTENVPGIAALGKAVEIAEIKLENNEPEKVKKLRDRLIDELLKIPGTRLNGSRDKRLWNNVNISFNNVEGEALVLLLDEKGVCCSTGSACSSHSLKSSSVLKAIELSDIEAHGSLRLTLGYQNTEQEIDYAIKEIKNAVSKLRGISADVLNKFKEEK